jgi:RNA polymerase sigma factor (sigma-70 family)
MSEEERKYQFEVITSKDATSSVSTEFPEFLLGNSLLEAEETLAEFETYVNNIAGLYAYSSDGIIDKSDFFGEAILALGRAKKDYNPKLGEFIPYAKFLIIDALNEYARRNRVLINIPSYVNKTNIIINRIKSRLSAFTSSPRKFLKDSNYKKYNIPKDVANKTEKDKELIARAAKRAKISYEELLDRSEFLPIVELETDYTFNHAIEAPYNQILAKLVVDGVMPHLSNNECLVAELLMDGKNKKEICRILERSNSWVISRINSIKRKILNI